MTAKERLQSMAPVLPEEPRVLILGSMPSELSLKHQQYYGNPRNHFWPLMLQLFDKPETTVYESRIQLLKEHHIALWDSIASCYRKGSLDGNITEVEPNDIVRLLKTYPTINVIACNGTKSFQVFQKHFGSYREVATRDVLRLPSTSPIPGRYTKTFPEKVEVWRLILRYL
ncbi:DNA-deoxyinosine glycosylase [Virgibacillus halophilus]|uniref:DNA-deoxyinosine glycosylase n=1 Tax=Tigheibacillus halophilus TaxID=361280 RepID=A0ABU5CC86_9BACI|nr:DNA-deoxyinosine glycosylase [Virgibacillus halophilus]